MQNLRRKYLQVLKIWNVDAIIHYRQAEKYLQVQRKASCRYNGLKKEHLQQRISEMCRYRRCQKSKFFWNSIYFNDDTPKSKKKTMQSSELESGLPDEAELELDIGIFILKKIPNGLSQKTVHLVLWKMQVQCYIKNIL